MTASGGRTGQIPHFQIYTPSAGGAVLWRLLSANNRDLGRSVEQFADLVTCQAAIVRFVALLDELVVVIRPDTDNRWVWRVSDETGLIAVSGHRFDRQVRCGQGWIQFQEAARRARIGTSLVALGARRGEPRRTAVASASARVIGSGADQPPTTDGRVEFRRFTPHVASKIPYRTGTRSPEPLRPIVDRG